MGELPTIKDIRFRPVLVPLARPIRTASGELPGAALGLIDVDTNADTVGRAYIFAYTPKMLRALAVLSDDIKDVFIGEQADPAALADRFFSTFRLLGTQGLLGMLYSGIDMALWDIRARMQDVTVAELMGGTPRAIRAYDSFGLIDPGQDLPLLDESLRFGFEGFKIKLGAGSVEDDVRSVAAVRDVIGPDKALMVDYNQSLGVAEALKRAEAIESYDIYWLEEPVPAEDLSGHHEIRGKCSIPVQTGENWWFVNGAANAINAEASAYIMPDLMKIGGFTGWMEVAELAQKADLPVSSHAFVEVSAHALCATPGFHWHEYLDKARPILREPLDVIDGKVTPIGPGVGMEWNMEKVEEFAF